MPRNLVFILLFFTLLLSGCILLADKDSDLEERLAGLETQVVALSTRSASDAEILSYLATRVDAVAIPPQSGVISPTPYHPVSGGILLENGSCCIGGTAGETIEIVAMLESQNPQTGRAVDSMRFAAGGRSFGEEELQESAWERYAPTRTFLYQPPINWSGFYVCVQFRDVDGNLSDVYCDDISVEGSPPAPTP